MWRLIEAAALTAGLFVVYDTRRKVMAIGPETQAALAELHERIQAEADQRAAEMIDAVGADAETAQAIRDSFTAVANIVPDPVGEPAEPETPEVPVEDVEAENPDQPA